MSANCDCPDFQNETSTIKNILPDGYFHHITSFVRHEDVQEETRFTIVMRLELDSKEAAMEWLRRFEVSSYTTMSVQRTYPHCKTKNVFRVDLCCHHNTHPRHPVEKRRVVCQPKHTACPDVMMITVKRIVRHSRSNDPHLPAYPMTVVLKFIHNHPIMAADVLKHRKVSEEIRLKFLDLFKCGHSPATALELHKRDLQEQYGEEYSVISADRGILPHRSWCYTLFYAATNNRLPSVNREQYAVEEGDYDDSAIKQLTTSTFEVDSQSSVGVTYSVDMHAELCSCPVGLTGVWCKHQAAVAAKYKLSTTNQMPKGSPELRRRLHCVAAGNGSAGGQSSFTSLNGQDEQETTPVTGSDFWETEAEGSDGDWVKEHEDNRMEGNEAQDGTDQIEAAREEGSNECEELLQRFSTFNDSIVAKVHKSPEVRDALRQFLDQGEKLKTDAALSSALHCFGRNSGQSSFGRKRPRTTGTTGDS